MKHLTLLGALLIAMVLSTGAFAQGLAAGAACSTGAPCPVTVNNAPTTLDFITADGRAQKVYVASTNTLAPNGTSFLNAVFCNLAGSGQLITIVARRFDSDLVTGQIPVKFGGIPSPAAITSPSVSVFGSNGYVGGAASTVGQLQAVVSTTRLNNAAGNATPTGTGVIPSGGESAMLNQPAEYKYLAPGLCFGQFITGQVQPAGLGTTAVNVAITFYFTQEPM